MRICFLYALETILDSILTILRICKIKGTTPYGFDRSILLRSQCLGDLNIVLIKMLTLILQLGRTMSKHKICPKLSEMSSESFLIFIDSKFTVRRVLRTPLCLRMAECFQVPQWATAAGANERKRTETVGKCTRPVASSSAERLAQNVSTNPSYTRDVGEYC